jgi:hypothetical protein
MTPCVDAELLSEYARKTLDTSCGKLDCLDHIPPKPADLFLRQVALACEAMLVINLSAVRTAHGERY